MRNTLNKSEWFKRIEVISFFLTSKIIKTRDSKTIPSLILVFNKCILLLVWISSFPNNLWLCELVRHASIYIKTLNEAGIMMQCAKLWHAESISHRRVSVPATPLPICHLVNAAGEAAKHDQVHRSLLLTWETTMQFRHLPSGPGSCRHSERVNQIKVCLSLSSQSCAFKNIFQKWKLV